MAARASEENWPPRFRFPDITVSNARFLGVFGICYGCCKKVCCVERLRGPPDASRGTTNFLYGAYKQQMYKEDTRETFH